MGAWRQQAQPTAAPTTDRDPTTTLSLGDAAAQAQSVVGRDTGRDGGTHRRKGVHGGRRGHGLVAGRGRTGTASGRGPRLETRPPGTQWTERGVEGRQDRSWASRPDSLDSPPKRVVSGPATGTQHRGLRGTAVLQGRNSNATVEKQGGLGRGVKKEPVPQHRYNGTAVMAEPHPLPEEGVTAGGGPIGDHTRS